ncbi:MAG: response regulator [Candidatus Aminicenantes bacterium]
MSVKIVVVDDDRATLALLERNLIMHGFWVYSAKDGEEGFDLVTREKPDLVVSDMLMPKIHGVDLCKTIKSNPELKNTKVIMMTGVYKGRFGLEEAFDSGADYFVTKPIDMETLLKKIFELLKIDEEEFRKEFVKNSSDEKN